MIILALDLAKKSAYSVGDSETGIEDFGSFSCENLIDAYHTFYELISKWKPKYIVFAKATYRINVIRYQSRIEGVLILVVQRYDRHKKRKDKIKIDGNLLDNKSKKEIVGNGSKNKQDTMDFFNQDDPDIADSMLFWHYFKRIKLGK